MKGKNTIWRWLSLLSFLLMVVINGYASTGRLNGITTAEVSDSFNVLFVPAGYVFSIWGVIYLFLIAFLVYQFTPKQKDNRRFYEIAPYFVICNIVNGIWLVLYHYQYHSFTILPMLILLICLIQIYLQLYKKPGNGAEYYFMDLPFSIYLGWICVATIANLTQFLDFIGFSGFGIAPEIWLIMVLAVAVLLSWAMDKKFHDLAYDLVLIWAFIGIGMKFLTNEMVMISSFTAAGLVFLLFLFTKRTENK